MLQETVRLFKGVLLPNETHSYNTDKIVKDTIQHGFLLDPEIFKHFSKKEVDDITLSVYSDIIITGEEMNSTFHKSWNKVKNAPYAQLVMEQIFHYMTTYGFEALGVYDKDSVYIPNEKLEVPELKEDGITLMVIKGYTEEELKERLVKFLGSGIALADDTMKDLVEILDNIEIEDLDVVKNKEIKMFLYDKLDQVPSNPTEFLRYLIFKATGKTLLIKNRNTINEIKAHPNSMVYFFENYDLTHTYDMLSTIFYRFKPLFLAFRVDPEMRPIINKLRKLATKYHIPMKEDYLNSVTKKIKDGNLSITKLKKELAKVNTFRKVRLAYALKYRSISGIDSIIYRIRNGKGYADSFSFDATPLLDEALEIVIDSIATDVAVNVKDKKIYIPDTMVYTLPATEKQFTGNFPSGSCVTIDKDMLFGIHWYNVNGNRIDLDLSMMDAEGKYGWDAAYRSEAGTILFSGDITDPGSNGASELFYVKKQANRHYLLNVNYYNFMETIPVPFKIIVGKKKLQSISDNYMLNPNNVLATANTVMDQKQKILGVVSTSTKECKFYFAEAYVGQSRSVRVSAQANKSREYLVNFYKNTISLNDILVKAGATIVHDENEKYDINLSPENLQKDTIIDLLV